MDMERHIYSYLEDKELYNVAEVLPLARHELLVRGNRRYHQLTGQVLNATSLRRIQVAIWVALINMLRYNHTIMQSDPRVLQAINFCLIQFPAKNKKVLDRFVTSFLSYY